MIKEHPMSLDSFDRDEERILDSLYSDLEFTMLNLTRNILKTNNTLERYSEIFGGNEYKINVTKSIPNCGIVVYSILEDVRTFIITVVIGDNYCDMNIRGMAIISISKKIKRFIRMYKEMIKEGEDDK